MARRLRLAASIALCAALWACGRAAPPAAPSPPPEHSESHFIPDMEDSCPILPSCPGDFFVDEDGCPDLVITFAAAAVEPDPGGRATLTEARDELRRRTEITALDIIAVASPGEPPERAGERAAEVTRRLAGARPGLVIRTRVEASDRVEPGYVWFEVECLEGARGAPRARRPGRFGRSAAPFVTAPCG